MRRRGTDLLRHHRFDRQYHLSLRRVVFAEASERHDLSVKSQHVLFEVPTHEGSFICAGRHSGKKNVQLFGDHRDDISQDEEIALGLRRCRFGRRQPRRDLVGRNSHVRHDGFFHFSRHGKHGQAVRR